jgi:hypothetical protein
MALTKIKNISIDPSFLITGNEINSTFTLTSKTVTVSTPTANTEAANKQYVDNAVAAVYNFKTLAVSGQSNIVADSAAATLTVSGSGGIVVTTDAATDTLDVGTNATSNDTANTLVIRDGSGNFSAGTITADLDGTLVNARNISLGGDATGTASFDASADITITTTLANTGVTAQTYGSATQVGEFTVDAKGRITSASNISIAIPSTQITDWQEAVEDTASASITGATHSGISFSYDDSTGLLAATVANQNKFDRIAVSGQTTVVADDPTDTVTFAGSTGLTITTNATTDVITFTNDGVTSAAVSGTGLSINSSTGAITITSNATTLNTGSTLVARDASGDFSAGVITADLLGDVTGDITGNITSTGSSSFSNITVTGGTIDDTIIGGTTPQAITGTTITANTQFSGNLVGDVTGDVTSSGTSTFATVDINGGNIDGTVIGASTPAAADFTDVTVTGFLEVDGGVLYVDPTNNYVGINDLTPAAALDVNGDAIVTGSMTVNTNLTVDGNLTVLGTTTQVESTVTTIVDPVLTVGQGTYSTNDGKARGIEFKYYDTAARTGFFGYDTTDGVFKLLKSASNNSEVFTGTKATLEANLDGYLVNARDIELVSDVTGLASFDGSANIQITTTLSNTGVTAGSYGAVDEVATFTVDAKGRLTAAGIATIAIPSTQVTDFDEAVRDAAALMITSATHTNVSVSYDDGADTLSFSVPGAESFSTFAVSGQTPVVADQANDTITFAGSTGLTITTNATSDTVTFTNDGVTSAAVSGVGLSINASTGAITITSDATNANTPSTIVSRDGSGNFSAGTITADLVGNASTASTWATARTITLAGDLSGSVTIDGSGNETLTATIEPDSVALGTDTTGDYVEDLIAGTGIVINNTGGEGSTPTIVNDDKGSDQMIFKSIAVSGQTTVTAGSNTETLTLVAGTGVTLTTDNTTKEVTITNAGLNAFKYVAVSGQTTVEADAPDDTLTLVGGTAISLSTDPITDAITIQNDGVTSLSTSGVGISVNTSTGVVTLTSDATPNNTAGTIVSRDVNGAFNAGDIGAEDITADSLTTVNGVTVGTLTAGRVTFAGFGSVLSDSADLTFDDSTDTLTVPNVNASTALTTPSATVSGLTATRVTFAGVGGLLSDSSDLIFNSGTSTLTTPNVNASTALTTPSATVSGLTNTRITFAGAGGLLSDSSDLIFNSGTSTLTTPNVNASTALTTPSATVSGLTATRVTFAGVGGLLSDNSDLTYNSGTNTLSASNVSATTALTTPSATVSGLTATRVTFAGVGGLLSDNSDLTYNAGTNTLSASNVDATTALTTPSATVSGLTATRITFAGVGGLLSDNSDLTYNSGTNTLGVSNVNATTAITTPSITNSGLTATRVTFAGVGGLLSDDADFTFDTASNTLAVTNVDATMVDAGDINIATDTISIASGDLVLSPGSGGAVDVDTHKIINVVDPTNNQDAATKKYVDDQLNAIDSLTIDGDTGGPSSVSFATDTLTIAGTANEVETSVSGQTITIGLPSDVTIGNDLTITGDIVGVVDITTTGNVIVGGDLTVQGTLTSLQTTNTEIQDNTITLNKGEVGAGVTAGTAGIEIDRGSADDAKLVWDEGTDTWKFQVGAADADVTVDDLTATTSITAPSITNSGLTATRVTFAGVGGLLSDDADFTFDTATDTLSVENLTVNTATQTDTLNAVTSITSPSITDSGLTATRITFAGTGGLLSDDADLTFDTATDTLTAKNLSVVTQATLASAAISDITATHVMFAGVSGEVTGDAGLTFDTTTDTLTATNLSVVTQATLASAAVSDLTATRIVFAGTSGELVDDADLTFDTATNTVSTVNVTASGTIEGADLKATNLTATRVVIAGTSGLLADDADLTYTTGTDTLNLVNMSITGNITGDLIPAVDVAQDLGSATNKWRDLYLSGTSIEIGTQSITSDATSISVSNDFNAQDISSTSLTVSGLTNTRITFAGASGLLSDDADLTYDTATDTLTVVNVDATDVNVSSLTQGRVVIAGANGAIVDDAGLTYDSSTDTLTTTMVMSDLTGDVTGDVTGNVISSNTSATVLDTSGATATFTGDVTGNIVSSNTSATVLDTSGATATFTGDVTGNITGQVSDISNHTLDDIGDVDLTGIQDQDTLRWDAATSSWIPSISGGFQMRRQRFTANGTSASFTLTYAPQGRDYLIVTVSGVPQGGDTFSVSGTTLTLGGTPQNGEIVEIIDFSTGVFSPAPNSTDDIAEGSSNFYYSDTRVKTLMGNGTLNSNIIPSADITFDLGSSTKRWRDLYLAGNTIHLGTVRIKDDAGTLKFLDANGDPVAVDLGTTLDPDIQIDGGSF